MKVYLLEGDEYIIKHRTYVRKWGFAEKGKECINCSALPNCDEVAMM